MRLVHKLLGDAITAAINHGADIRWSEGYAEPGYSDDSEGGGVFLANWNPREFGENRSGHPFKRPVHTVESRIGELIERSGYASMEWSDEWVECYDCGKAVRTTPDSYSWLPSYILLHECEPMCRDCVLDDLDEYEAHLLASVDSPERMSADTFDVDWSERGFEPMDYEETGMHPGQDADPKETLRRVRSAFPDADVLFSIDSTGQFDTRWRAWVRESTDAE